MKTLIQISITDNDVTVTVNGNVVVNQPKVQSPLIHLYADGEPGSNCTDCDGRFVGCCKCGSVEHTCRGAQ